MIETVAILNRKVQIELTRKNKMLSIILLILGSLGLITFVVMESIKSDIIYGLLLLSALPFTVGLISLVFINKSIRNFKFNNVLNNYQFNTDHFIVRSFKDNEEIGMSKIEYSQIFKTMETKTFLFVFTNQVSAYPIIKATLSNEQMEQIKSLIKNPPKKSETSTNQ